MEANNKSSIRTDDSRNRVTQAVRQDNEHQLRQEAKKRAAQSGVDYETFEALVQGAHLQPINQPVATTESLNAGLKSLSINPILEEKEKQRNKQSQEDLLSHEALPPKSMPEFERDWARYGLTSTKRYRYLCLMDPVDVTDIFSCGIGFEVLGNVIRALSDSEDCWEMENNQLFVLKLLDRFSLTQGFSLAVEFFEEDEKSAARRVFDVLKKWLNDPQNEAHQELFESTKVKYCPL